MSKFAHLQETKDVGSGGADVKTPLTAEASADAAVAGPAVGLRARGDKDKPKEGGMTLRRLLSQAYPERCLIAFATGSLLLSSIANLGIPAFVGSIIDAISTPDGQPVDNFVAHWGFGDSRGKVLTVSVICMAIVIVLSAVFAFAYGASFMIAGERVVARVRKNLFNAILGLEIAFFDATRTGELVNRLSADCAILKDAVTWNISMGMRWTATVFGGIAYLFVISWKLTLVMLCVVPVVAISARSYGMKLRKLSQQTQESLARATEVAEESISQIRTVRSFYREPLQQEYYADRIDETYKLGARIGVLYGAFVAVIGIVASGAMMVVLWYGATLVLNGQMTAGVLTSYVLYTLTVGFALAGLSGLFGNLMKAVGAVDRVFEILDRRPLINIEGGQRIEEFKGIVEFKDVSFSYPTRPGAQVLSNIDLELKPGTVTALVGASGGGKSTVVALLERFYDADAGRILLDGRDLRTIDPAWLHRNIGLVSQEPVLFACSIRDNLTYGVDNVRDEQIDEACRVANAYDFIHKLPDGYHTTVGERGIRLSGGQKQRVAIARAVLMNPKVLIADEATSSLDSESEHHVQEALDRLMQQHNRTVVVIAHRLSTVVNADQVIVIDGGRIVERGTHKSLLEKNGVYAKLVRRQLQDRSPSFSLPLSASSDSLGAAGAAAHAAGGENGFARDLSKPPALTDARG